MFIIGSGGAVRCGCPAPHNSAATQALTLALAVVIDIDRDIDKAIDRAWPGKLVNQVVKFNGGVFFFFRVEL